MCLDFDRGQGDLMGKEERKLPSVAKQITLAFCSGKEEQAEVGSGTCILHVGRFPFGHCKASLQSHVALGLAVG